MARRAVLIAALLALALGFVPIAALGEAAGVRTPLMRMLIELTSRIHGVDHWSTGRSLAKMGLEARTRDEIRRVAEEGFR